MTRRIKITDQPITRLRTTHRVRRIEFSPDSKFLQVNNEVWHVPTSQRFQFRLNESEFKPRSVSISNDCKYIACVSYNGGMIAIYEAHEGTVGLARTLKIGASLKDTLAHPWHTLKWSTDNKFIIAVSQEMIACIENPLGQSKERVVRHPDRSKNDSYERADSLSVSNFAICPDNKHVAVAFRKAGVFVFELAGGRLAQTLRSEEAPDMWTWEASCPLMFSDDGSLLVAHQTYGGKRGTDGKFIVSTDVVRIWDTSSLSEAMNSKMKEITRDSDPLTTIGFISGTTSLVTFSYRAPASLAVWDGRSGGSTKTIKPLLLPSRTTDVSASRAGGVVMFNQVDGPLQLWRIDKVEPVAQINDPRFLDPRNAAISPGGKLVATGYPDGEICIWDVGNSGREISFDELVAQEGTAAREHEQRKRLPQQAGSSDHESCLRQDPRWG